ncbi:MAG: hypothetical protein HKM89_13800 [Gemmatimonadales bacterium]|nr:hypothetical protein [Gemmatimonadales bacterium]
MDHDSLDYLRNTMIPTRPLAVTRQGCWTNSKFWLALALLLLARGASLPAQEGDWAFTVHSAAELELPKSPSVESALGYLDYQPGEPVFGFRADLNRDGSDDYVVRSSTRLCGTGGCSYALIDGKRLERLGQVFGNPIVIRGQMINGYPVVNAYGHSSADSGTYGTFVFDGEEYVLVSGVHLSGESLSDLFDKLNRVPHR